MHNRFHRYVIESFFNEQQIFDFSISRYFLERLSATLVQKLGDLSLDSSKIIPKATYQIFDTYFKIPNLHLETTSFLKRSHFFFL